MGEVLLKEKLVVELAMALKRKKKEMQKEGSSEGLIYFSHLRFLVI